MFSGSRLAELSWQARLHGKNGARRGAAPYLLIPNTPPAVSFSVPGHHLCALRVRAIYGLFGFA